MGILEEVKSVAKTIQQIDNIDLYKRILDLQAHIMTLVEENNGLKTELRELKEKFKVKEKLLFGNNAYWLKRKDGSNEGPFCSNCWDVKQVFVRMLTANKSTLEMKGFQAYRGKVPIFKCQNCGSMIYRDPALKG
ncbi:MAG TPA: hypothetical protein VN328_10970 [Thermodesulfovibrionales bacterium]|nr:hypothetical protein [Thermodesulfovibrionales bacterium]